MADLPVRSSRPRELSRRQQAFIKHVADGHTATKAYQAAYGCTLQTADANASRLRKKLASHIATATKERLTGLAPKAVNTLGTSLEHNSGRVALEAAKTILDRSGMGAVAGNGSAAPAISINIDLSGYRRLREEPAIDVNSIAIPVEPTDG